jgi:ethanolamine ammonia-lyase small subunit
MDTEQIESIVNIVLNNLDNSFKATEEKGKGNLFKVWDHVSQPAQQKAENIAEEADYILPELVAKTGVNTPRNLELLSEAIKKTPSRIGVGRAGVRPKTETWLKFRLDHAAAVDAVYGEVDEQFLRELQLFTVDTQVQSKEEYLLRPDLGRRLSEEAKRVVKDRCIRGAQVQVLVSNGLSSQAVEANLEDVYLSFQQSLKQLGIQQGTPFFIKNGRVAVMDEVGELLQPEVVALLIGERPGLVSAESLSVYLCYKPRKETIEADRMVISNIHLGGIPPAEAGAYLGTLVQKILKYQASGVSLVKKEQ